MRQIVRMLALAIVLASPISSLAAEKVANPFYTYWSSFKPGTTVTLTEQTTFGDDIKELVPKGIDQKIIRYRLLKVAPKQVIVQATLTERDFLSNIVSAPTRIIYPAEVDKEEIETVLYKVGAEFTDANVTIGEKSYPCKKISGTRKTDSGEITYDIYISSEVPGGIVKRKRTTRKDGQLIAETTVELRRFTKAE